jgi:hypothetical protein
VAEDFLGAQAGDDFGIAVEFHPVAPFVAQAHFAAQIPQTVGHGVAVVTLVFRRFHQLLDHLGRGNIAGVAHPQVDHIHPGTALLVLEGVDFPEEIRGQAFDAIRHLNPEGVLRCIWLVLHERETV